MTNQEKAEAYSLLKTKLKKALAASFWFEALMIEYAIMEDRTSSILQHGAVCNNAYDPNKSLVNKIRSINLQIGKRHPVISKKVNLKTINEILEWKEARNELVHRACNHIYDESAVRDLALQGNELVRKLINDSRKVSNAYKK